jgi:radical SAM protein with 4Fe4S-binding SPASM domain
LKKDRLKPYVYKVKGVKCYALFDILNGNFFRIKPEGKIDELRKQLIEADLIFETEGIVPAKIEYDLSVESTNINIRELQIRLNGRGEDNCWRRIKKKQKGSIMNLKTLKNIIKNFQEIPIDNIRIEAEHFELKKIQKIIDETNSRSIELYIEEGIDKENFINLRKLCESRNKKLSNQKNGKKKIDELHVDAYNFFYSQKFNLCLGHKIAIDTGGEIKPCLWLEKKFGNIVEKNIKRLIISGVLDECWEIKKDEIEVCKDCEFRYNCLDCRVSTMDNTNIGRGKPEFCEYDPSNISSLKKPDKKNID